MKVLVTGASGFIGRILSRHLLQQGWSVRAASRSAPPAATLPPGMEVVRIPSVDGATDWSGALGGVDGVVHLAARVHVMHESHPDPPAAFRTVNTEGTRRLAAMAAEAGVRRIVYASSIKVNGEQTTSGPFTESHFPSPDDAYGISKWEAEQALWEIARRSSLEVVVLRPPMVYGPGAPGNFNRLLRFIRMGIPLPFGSVRNQRSFMYVENLCDAIRACLQHPGAAGRTFLLSDGEDISTPELIRLLSKYLGRSSRLLPFPPALLEAGARMVGFHGEAERLLRSLRVDSSAFREALQWDPPYPLREGLRATAEAYLAAVEGTRARPATHQETSAAPAAEGPLPSPSPASPAKQAESVPPDRARPVVSIVVPMLNEENHVGGCLDSILSGSFPLERCEVLVVDGGSVDRSREIVQDRMKQSPSLRLLENPQRVKGVAMNIGIRNARGKYILRMDAHSEYPRDYVQNCLEELERTGADNVGGSWTVVPAKPTFLAKALALTVQHPFGVGDAKYRVGGGGYVDTVPFGAFRREVFVRVGLFRENLVVHQDYEMNARIRAAGGKIYLSERIHNTYFHVSTLGGYLRKAWSYGYWSARSTLLHPYSFAWRHFASLLFVLVLLAGAGVAAFWRPAGVGVIGILAAYALLAVVASAQVGWQEGWRFVPLLPVLFFLRHITYGLGTLAGFLDHFIRPVRKEELPSLQ